MESVRTGGRASLAWSFWCRAIPQILQKIFRRRDRLRDRSTGDLWLWRDMARTIGERKQNLAWNFIRVTSPTNYSLRLIALTKELSALISFTGLLMALLMPFIYLALRVTWLSISIHFLSLRDEQENFHHNLNGIDLNLPWKMRMAGKYLRREAEATILLFHSYNPRTADRFIRDPVRAAYKTPLKCTNYLGLQILLLLGAKHKRKVLFSSWFWLI